MTLKQSYYDGLTGLQQQLNDAFDAGVTFVADNNAVITSALTSAAALGNTTFTLSILTSYKTAALRLNGLLLKSYLAGITDGLAAEDVYSFECTPTLNTTSATDTAINLNFNFATT